MADTLKPDPSRIARRLSSSTTGEEEVFEYDLVDYEPQPLPETEEVEYEEVIDYIDRTGEKVQVPVYNESGKKIYRPTYNEQGVMTHDERGIMTFDEWKRKSEEGVDWWPIAKEAVAGLARGFTKIPGKIEKEGFMEASANIPESFLAATEGLKLIGGGVGRFVAQPFRSDEEEDAAEYAAYKEFGNQIFRQLELRKSRMGDVARLFGAEDLAAVYDDGIDPEIADSLSLIFDPTYLVGGGLVKVGAAAARQAPKVTNKYAKKLIEAAGKAAETQAAKQVGEFLAKPVTSTVSGIGTATEKVGRGVQKLGETGARIAEKSPKVAGAAQVAVGAGTGAVLAPEGQELTGALGGAFGGKYALSSKTVIGAGEKIEKNAQRLGGAAQAAKINSLRTSGLGTVAKIRPMREEVAKQFVTLDNRVANRLLSEAGKLADTAVIGAGMGAGIGAFMPYDPTNPGYIAGMALGTLAAPAGMYSAGALNQLARVELAKGAVPDAGLRLRLKETPMHQLASEAVVKRFLSALPEQQRVRFVDPDRGLSVADLANQAEAVDLFMGAMRDKGKDVNFFIGNTPEILEKTGGTAREGVAGFYDPDSNTVFVNTDAETPSFTLFHELFHPTERWSAMRKELDADTGETVKSDPLQDIQTDLAQTIFGTYGPDGEVIQPGLYSKEDMLSFADQYNSRLYPDLSTEIKEVKAAIEAEKKKTLPEIDGIEPPETPEMRLLNRELEELQTRQEGNQKELAAFDALPDATKRDYMARELMSDYFAMFGESARHGIIRKARNITLKKDYFKDKFLGMNIDRLKMATLGNLRKLLEGAGVEFDLAGNPRGEMTATSALFKDPETGRELVMSPQIEHLLAQYITEKDKLVSRVSETDDVGGSEITLSAKDVLKKNPDGTPKIPEAEIKRWASSGWLKTDKEGNVLNSTGGRWQPGQRPAFTTARERTRMDKNRVAALVTALTPVTEKIAEGDPGSLTVKARETADGGTNFRGSYFDEQQMDAIMATPDDVIHPDLKSVIKTMNDAIKEGKGAPFLADYWKAITGRGYDSKARMKVQLFTPIGMQISSAGNFNATVFNIGYFENKINRWLGQSGKKKFWSDWADADGRVDVDSFRTDMMELLKTHYENDPSKKFPEGMKKEKLYSFLGVKPEDLSRKDWNRAAKDFKLFISLRFDRMKDVTRGMGDNFPVNYYKAKQRFMPGSKTEAGGSNTRYMPPPPPTTPQFKRFFKGSKVVDDDGEPLVVFRGTVKKPSTEKFRTRLGRSTPTFTSVPEVASLYSHKEGFAGPEPKGSVFPVYLSIKQPYDIRDIGARATLNDFIAGRAEAGKGDQGDYFEAGDVIEILEGFEELRTAENIEVDAEGYASMFRNQTVSDVISDINKALDDVDKGVFSDTFGTEKVGKELAQEYFDDWLSTTLDGIELDAYHLADNPAFVDVIKRSGYDGIIHTDTIELGAPYFTKESVAGRPIDEVDLDPTPEQSQISEDTEHTTYRPLQNNQIKSVFNKGEFDPKSPDIRFMPGIERVANNEPGLAAETVKIKPGALDGVRFMPGTKVPKITLEKIVESDPFIITADSMADMTYTVPDSGVEIKLHGGPMFSYRPGKAVWASNKGAASRIGNFVERTGQRFALIMLQNGTNHSKNKSMGRIFVEELKARSGAKKIKQGDLKKMLKFASDRAGLEKPIKNLAELEDFYSFWDWDTRGNFFQTFGLVRTPIGDPKKAGFFDYNQIVRDTTQPEFLDKPTGTVVGAIEFKSGKRFSAEELGAEPHSSYDTMLEGRGVGLFKNPPHISDVLDAPESQRSVFTLQKRLSSPNRLREAADAEKKLNAIRRHRNKNAVRNTKKAQ